MINFKKISIFLLLIVFIITPSFVLAEEVDVVTASVLENDLVPADYFYSNTFDNLALDFTITPTELDTLDAITVKNVGNARYNYEIEKLLLYADDGPEGFDGFAIDNKLAESEYDYNTNSFVFDDIGLNIPASGTRLFVTVETLYNGTDTRIVQMFIPAQQDFGVEGVYNSGDEGIFLTSGAELPASDLLPDGYSRYRKVTYDIWAPTVVVENLADGKTFNNIEEFTITGQSRDSGVGQTSSIEICIDNTCTEVNERTSDFATWDYLWQFSEEGEHEVFFRSFDNTGNFADTETMTITVNLTAFISYKYTTIDFNKVSALANGQDKIKIDIFVGDQFGNAVPGQLIEIKTSSDDVLVNQATGISDDEGLVYFESWSSKAGDATYSFYFNSAKYNADFNVSFKLYSEVIDYTDGRFVKLPDHKAVYFLDNENVRHAYPTQAIWESYFGEDFSFVETINTEEMSNYSLGRNVPFKKGMLMKIPSVPKVYEVGDNGVIYWITSADVAVDLFGSNWIKQVKDLPESFFLDYVEGISKS